MVGALQTFLRYRVHATMGMTTPIKATDTMAEMMMETCTSADGATGTSGKGKGFIDMTETQVSNRWHSKG